MSLTRSNIAYNLKISPHEHTEYYEDGIIKFVFSSELYKKKFLEKLEIHRIQINNSLSNRFGVQFRCDALADIRLYTTIEKRGFLLYKDKKEVTCLEDLGYSLILQILKN